MTVRNERLEQFIQGIDLEELAQEFDLGCIEHDLKDMAQELLSTRKTLKSLRELMGYVENDSFETVILDQDDATRTYTLSVGKKTYWGHSLENVIEKAFEAEGEL